MIDPFLVQLVKKENWEFAKHRETGDISILAYGETYPLVHPYLIHAKRFREFGNPDEKYFHMKAIHDYFWPDAIWHAWTEERYRAHCAGWTYTSLAGGASAAKSHDVGGIVVIDWIVDPQNRTIIVASTTLEGLSTRVWGYVTKALKTVRFPLAYKYVKSGSPKILWAPGGNIRGQDIEDTIHGVFAIAAKQGSDDEAIKNWIGRHPNKYLHIVFDEGTDMPPAVIKSAPNLSTGGHVFQCTVIGNSKDENDLHGAMSTPDIGFDKIDPMRHTRWTTSQDNGICLFSSCYESPAIWETDPIKKEKLGFLFTREKIEKKKQEYGDGTTSFWRFVVGFWNRGNSEKTIISREFMRTFNIHARATWSGLHPIRMVAGLDASFSTGGDATILRLGLLGHTIHGKMVLDFRGESLLFRITIMANAGIPAESQIALQVKTILNEYKIPLSDLCMDATGQGRALGEVIRLTMDVPYSPIRIYSAKTGGQKNSFDVIVMTPYEIWYPFRSLLMQGQIMGIDGTTAFQLSNRLIVKKGERETLETKLEYKSRIAAASPAMAHSPDEADSASLCLQSAIRRYGFYAGQKLEIKTSEQAYIDARMVEANKALSLKESMKRVEMPKTDFTSTSISSFARHYKPF